MNNPLNQILESINALGPDVQCRMYRFAEVEQAKAAAYAVVDNLPAIVSLARAQRASIGTIKMADATMLVLGGLISGRDMQDAHRLIVSAGGALQAAVL